MNELEYIGNVLKAIRRHRGISVDYISSNYKISSPSIYDYEKGRYSPKSKNLQELCMALGINLETFEKETKTALSDGLTDAKKTATNIINRSKHCSKLETPTDYPYSTFADCVNILIDRLIDDEEIDNDVKIQMLKFLKAQKQR